MSADIESKVEKLHAGMTALRKDMEEGDNRLEKRLTDVKEALEMDVAALRDKVTRIELKQDSHHIEQMSAINLLGQRMSDIYEKALNSWPSSSIRWLVGIFLSVLIVSSGISLVVIDWIHK